MYHATRLPLNRAPVHPGEILEEDYRIPLGLTQQQFAERLGIDRVRYNAIARGKRSVTPNTALRLARVLDTSVEVWLRLQMMVDLYAATHGDDAAEIEALHPIDKELVGAK